MNVSNDIAAIAKTHGLDGVPTVDMKVGLQTPVGQLKSFTTLTSADGVYYNKSLNVLAITKDGVTLDGYDLRGVSINVQASNVTIKNSYFDASTGNYAINAFPGTSGLTVLNSTFDGLKLDKPGYVDFITSRGADTVISGNVFLNAPSDAIAIASGSVTDNYISGGGYATGAHADAIWISGTVGAVVVSSNVIDWRSPADAIAGTNEAIRITGESGPVDNVTVTNNILLGGSQTILVSNGETQSHKASQVGAITNVKIYENVVDYGVYGSLDMKARPTDMVYRDNWHASGKPLTPGQEATGAMPDLSKLNKMTVANPTAAITGTAKADYLVGGDGSNWLSGGAGDDVLWGGAGRDYLIGGAGKDLFVYTSVKNSGLDLISDFTRGEDKIVLSSLEGAPTSITAWQWLGAESFTGHTWQLRASYDGKYTTIEVDADGDLVADLQIQLNGKVDVSTSDFILADKIANKAPVVTGVTAGAIVEGETPGVGGTLTFKDDVAGTLTVSLAETSVKFTNAAGVDKTASLSAADLAALRGGFTLPTGKVAEGDTKDWSYAVADKALDFLAAGETAKIVATIKVVDASGAVTTKDVIVTVTGTNDAPVFTGGATSAVVTEAQGVTASAQTLTQTGALTFADPDLSDKHTVSVRALDQYAVGTMKASIVSDANGVGKVQWTYNVPDKSLDYLGRGETLVQSYEIELSDGKGGVVRETVTVTHVGQNDQPIITGTVSAGWYEGTAAAYDRSGALYFADVDRSDKLVSSIDGQSVSYVSSKGVDMTSVLSADKVSELKNAFVMATGEMGASNGSQGWNFKLSDDALNFLGKDDTLKIVTSVKVVDGNGGSAMKDVVVTVRGSNDAPDVAAYANGDAAISATVTEKAGVTGDTSLHKAAGQFAFSDADLSDVHTVRSTALGSGYVGTFTAQVLNDTTGGNEGKIAWSFNVADNALDKLGAGQTLTQTYAVQINDGKSGVVTQNVTVTLVGASDQFDFQTTARKALTTFAEGDVLAFKAAALGGGIKLGALDDSFFVEGTAATAVGHGQFIHNAAQKQLLWDADGVGGKAPIVVASFASVQSLHANDFLIM